MSSMDTVVDNPVVITQPKITLRAIVQLKLKGLSDKIIAEKFNVTQQAINKRIQGLYTLIDSDKLQTYRENKINLLNAVEVKLLSNIIQPAKLKKMSARDATISYGIIYDKCRLEQGKAGMIIDTRSVVSRAEAELDQIRAAMEISVNNPITIEAELNSDNKGDLTD